MLKTPRSPPDESIMPVSVRKSGPSSRSFNNTRMCPNCWTMNVRVVSPGGAVTYSGARSFCATTCSANIGVVSGGGGSGGGSAHLV